MLDNFIDGKLSNLYTHTNTNTHTHNHTFSYSEYNKCISRVLAK